MNLFYRFIWALVYIPTKIFFPTKIINKHLIPKEKKVVIMANHLSWIDILLIAINIPTYRRFIAKKELGKNPVIRFFARCLGVIMIDREKTDVATIKEILTVMKKGHGLNIFPEGTRNKVDTSIQPIKSGVVMFALKGNAPIVPVLICNKAKMFKKNYMLIGEKIDLDEFKNKQISTVLPQATELVEETMKSSKQYLDTYVQNKQWVLDKQARKQLKREKKALKKAEKRKVNSDSHPASENKGE